MSRSPSIAAPRTEYPTVIIEPSQGWVSLNLKDLWLYRELIYFLTWRDIKIRYKQTVLGVAWAVLQPLLTVLIFSLIFGKVAKIGSDGMPYPVFSLAGVAPWTFFQAGLNFSANSLVASSNMIKKVYFPRLIIPMASVLSGLVDLAVSMVLLVAMMAWYRVPLTPKALWLPLLLMLALVTSLGAGLWLSALNVQYRDVRYVVPFLMQFWMYATPVVYPSSRLPEPWRTLMGLNPMAGVVEGFRWSLLGARTQPGPLIAVSAVVSVAILVMGALYFRRMEKTFADVV